MSQVCQVTGKRPVYGNRVSHSNRKTRRRWNPNLHWKRFWSPEQNRWVRLRVSSAGLRQITKRGVDVVLGEIRARGGKI